VQFSNDVRKHLDKIARMHRKNLTLAVGMPEPSRCRVLDVSYYYR